MKEFKTLLFENQDGLGILTMNRPAALNALNAETMEELLELLSAIKADPTVKVLIITGAEKSVVAGADIKEMLPMTAAEGQAWGRLGQSVFSLIDRGFVHAMAHVRGGHEKGERWHRDGRGLMKRNSFTDFIAAGETLTLTLTAKAGDLRRLTARGRPIAVDPWPSCRADRRLRRGHQRFRLGQARRWPRRPAPGR